MTGAISAEVGSIHDDQFEPGSVRESLAEAITRGCSFLERAQVANGRWLDFRSERLISSHWVTAYVGSQLAQAVGRTAAVDRACAWLLHNQHPAGGWGYNLANPPDADSIANVIHLLVQCGGTRSIAAAIDEATGLLSRYWVESAGGFQTYHPIEGDDLRYPGSSWCDAHVSVTAMCATALAVADEQAHRQIVEACAGHVRSLQRPDGLWDAFWWDGRTYATYHAARLLQRRGDAGRVAHACEGLVRVRHAGGGWGNTEGSESAPFHTALALSTLLLDPDDRHAGAVHEGLWWLLRTQEWDGGWSSVPILRVPRPQAHAPWNHPDEGLVPLAADGKRLFTTATVISALVMAGRRLRHLDRG
jgi:squalene-hopene/tetraprenyl-beta-curcumene cyclase